MDRNGARLAHPSCASVTIPCLPRACRTPLASNSVRAFQPFQPSGIQRGDPVVPCARSVRCTVVSVPWAPRSVRVCPSMRSCCAMRMFSPRCSWPHTLRTCQREVWKMCELVAQDLVQRLVVCIWYRVGVGCSTSLCRALFAFATYFCAWRIVARPPRCAVSPHQHQHTCTYGATRDEEYYILEPRAKDLVRETQRRGEQINAR